MARKVSLLDDDVQHIDDDDGGTETDVDVCERCGHIRSDHTDDAECTRCKCWFFKE